MTSPARLVATLLAVTPAEYVRFTADWLSRADDLLPPPPFAGAPVIDALVAAAAEHAARESGRGAPTWTNEPSRFLAHPWWGGRPLPSQFDLAVVRLVPHSLVPRLWRQRYARAWLYRRGVTTTPPAFRRRGLIIGQESLTSM